MGKIKSKMIKKTSKDLVNRGIEFTEDFDQNKKILGDTIYGKKTRNRIAGYLIRVKKEQKKAEIKLEKA